MYKMEQNFLELSNILFNFCEVKENTLFHCNTAHYQHKMQYGAFKK